MSSVPMPRDLSEEAVRTWLFDTYALPGPSWLNMARAVRALLRTKVREAAGLACRSPYSNTRSIVDYVVSRVLGDHPEGGHEAEGREEAPRG